MYMYVILHVYVRVCACVFLRFLFFSFTDYSYPQATIDMFENDKSEEYDLYS